MSLNNYHIPLQHVMADQAAEELFSWLKNTGIKKKGMQQIVFKSIIF